MKVGDLVRMNDVSYMATSFDSYLGLFSLTGWDLKATQIPGNHPGVTVMANPVRDWPFVALPRRKAGDHVRRVIRDEVDLIPLLDWTPGDLLRAGGPIFFNPALGLRMGDVLAFITSKDARGRISITRTFGTLRRKRLIKNHSDKAREKTQPTAYDRLLGDPFEDT